LHCLDSARDRFIFYYREVLIVNTLKPVLSRVEGYGEYLHVSITVLQGLIKPVIQLT